MLREIAFLMLLVPATALAQSASDSSPMMTHRTMDHAKMHGQMERALPTEPGQSAFAAIQEIVELLANDPHTDWSKVDIDALREHLVDMDAVTLHARVDAQSVAGGIAFEVTGEGPVTDSIRHMVMAHAAAMDGVNGWQYTAAETAGGATMTVVVPSQDQEKLRALGFFGVLTVGKHHQEHHLMIARGEHPHN
jgi:hypothetical protein